MISGRILGDEDMKFKKIVIRESIPLDGIDPQGGIDPPAERLERRMIDVNGRKEHEAMLRDPQKCKELGIDHVYECIVYLKRWGGWLNDENGIDQRMRLNEDLLGKASD